MTYLVQRIHRGTLDQLTGITERLCCEYSSRPPDELGDDAHHHLHYVQRLLKGSLRSAERRELLVIAGWLALLIGCVSYDRGLARPAEAARSAAFQLGRAAGHGEIIAWSFEMSAWFALTRGHLRSVLDHANAGIAAAPRACVAVQLAAHAAKAHARMGHRDDVHRALDQGLRLLDSHERPTRPENHFVIDPTKWDLYAMDCYRVVGNNTRAAEHAHEILRRSRRSDGSDRSPMRASEARLTLSVVSLRDGDIDGATDWAQKALSTHRKSVNDLSMIIKELYDEAREQFGDDPAINALNNLITAFSATPARISRRTSASSRVFQSH